MPIKVKEGLEAIATGAVDPDRWDAYGARELVDAFEAAGADIESLQILMFYRQYLSDVFGTGEERARRVEGMSAEQAKRLLLEIMEDAEQLVEAAKPLTNALISRRKTAGRAIAKRGASARLVNDRDGKQAAKAAAFELWQRWRSGSTLHKSNAAFARHIVESLPIESTKTVERWIKDWRESAK